MYNKDTAIYVVGLAFLALILWADSVRFKNTRKRTQNVDRNLTIATYIKIFVNERAASKEPHFFANALREFVSTNSGTVPAPGTTDRILRKLRQKGEIDYAVENRKLSYYLAKPVVK